MADFGELSKKLAEVWKQLPEKDKLVSTLPYKHSFPCFMPSKMCHSHIAHPANSENSGKKSQINRKSFGRAH